jgi:hypothetical protein
MHKTVEYFEEIKICRNRFYFYIQDSNTSVTQTTWFWPLLSICLALLLSVPCTLIAVVIFYYKKKRCDDSDESSIGSNPSSASSSSSTPVQQRPIHHHSHPPQRSHYAGGFRSPPPPYTTNEQPSDLFITSSLPPPYDSHLTEDHPGSVTTNPTATIINVEPAESNEEQSTNTLRVGTTLDTSTLTNPSMQTFQA